MKFDKEKLEYVLEYERSIDLLEPGSDKKLEFKYEFFKKEHEGKVWSEPIKRGVGSGFYGDWNSINYCLIKKADVTLEDLNEYMIYLIDREGFSDCYNIREIYFRYLSCILFFKDELSYEEKYPQNLLTKQRIFEEKAKDEQRLRRRYKI